MQDKRSADAVQKYFESATEEERREFTDALLTSKSRARKGQWREVPRRIIFLSRLLSLLLVAFTFASMEWDSNGFRWAIGLLLLGVLAWFPNHMGMAVGRLFIGAPIRSPSNPWVVLVLTWVMLLLAVVASWGQFLDWVAA